MSTNSRSVARQLYADLLRMFSMHPTESSRALITFFYLFLVIASYMMIK